MKYDLPLAFVHVPKTGGTSVCDWIDQHFRLEDQLVCDNDDHFRKVAGEKTNDAHAYLPHPMIRGHFFLADGLKYARLLGTKPRLFFTIVRAPEPQLMSLLWHMVGNKRELVDGRNHPPVEVDSYMEDYVEAAASLEFETNGAQCHFFSDALNDVLTAGRASADLGRECTIVQRSFLNGVHIVGINEKLQESLQLVAWAMGWRAPRGIGHARLSGAGDRGVPTQVNEILWRRLKLDRALHEAAQARFSADYARLCAVAGSAELIDDFLDLKAATRAVALMQSTTGSEERSD